MAFVDTTAYVHVYTAPTVVIVQYDSTGPATGTSPQVYRIDPWPATSCLVEAVAERLPEDIPPTPRPQPAPPAYRDRAAPRERPVRAPWPCSLRAWAA